MHSSVTLKMRKVARKGEDGMEQDRWENNHKEVSKIKNFQK